MPKVLMDWPVTTAQQGSTELRRQASPLSPLWHLLIYHKSLASSSGKQLNVHQVSSTKDPLSLTTV